MLLMVFLSIIMSIFVGIQDAIIQKFAIRIAGGYISSKTGVEVQIGQLYISPNFTILIDHFLIKDLNDADLLRVKQLKVRPMMEEIVHGNIRIARVEMKEANANLITYEGEDHLNFQFLLDLFPTTDKPKKETPTVIDIDRVLLKDLNFQFWNQNMDKPERLEAGLIDYSHLVLSDINLDLERLSIVGDSITAKINRLAASEASGFDLRYLESDVVFCNHAILLNGLNIETPYSDLDLDLQLLYKGLKAMQHFTDSVTIQAQIRPSDLTLSDLGPFSQTLYTMDDPVHFEGQVNGTTRSLNLNGMKLDLGEMTHFEGDLALHPLGFSKSRQKLKIKKMKYSYEDLVNFSIPGFDASKLPSVLSHLGQGTLTGFFNGTMERFNTELDLTSEIGALNATISRQMGEHHTSIFDGHIEAKRVNAGVLANAPKLLGELDLSADIILRHSKSSGLDLDIDGDINDFLFNGTLLSEISLNGNLHNQCFNGKIDINDNDLDLDFKGRFDFTDPKSLGGDFQADIHNADLHRLNLLKKQEVAMLRASIQADMTSINKFNDAEGTLTITDFAYANSDGVLEMQRFDGTITNDNLLMKRIDLGCDFLDFEMAGQMDFTTLGIAFKRYINKYVQFPNWDEQLKAFEESGKTSDQDFIVHLDLKDPKPLTSLFLPKLSVAKGTSLNGTFTSRTQSLNLTLRSRYVKFSKIRFNEIVCRTMSSPRRSILRLNMDEIILRDSTASNPQVISLEQFAINNTLMNDSIKTNLSWNNTKNALRNSANLNTAFVPALHGGRLSFMPSSLVLNDTLWTFSPDNCVEFDQGDVRFTNLDFHSKDQGLVIDGELPMEAEDTLSLAFKAFNLATLNFLLNPDKIDLGGRVNGEAHTSNLRHDMAIIADIVVNGLKVNGETYGDAMLFSEWNNEENAVGAELALLYNEHKTIGLNGNFYLSRPNENLDFTAHLDGFNLGILSPFLSNFIDRFQGLSYGDLTIKGSSSNPDVQGQLRIEDGGGRMKLLNTYYSFSPTIELTENLITLETFPMIDTLGHSAMVTGYIRHHYLKDFELDLTMYPSNFLAMNTLPSKKASYYGTVFASGIVNIKGPLSNIDLTVRAITREGTSLTLPLGGHSNVKKHDFITFVPPPEQTHVNDDEEEDVVEVIEHKRHKHVVSNNINLTFNLNVNKNAQIGITLPNNLGSLEARGSGNLKFGLATSTNAMTLIGEYVIEEGGLSLVLEEIIRKNFSLQKGSSITWTGDPINGTINATGVYQTKASLSGLGLIDTTSMSASNAKVECLVHLKNKLMNPDISFGIRLPGASEDLQQAVFNVIDTTNQSEMLQQTISLLVFNSFSYGTMIDGYGILSSQINDILSQLTNDIDINFNYKAGNELSNEEVTLAMKKQLFDDRLTIETNFGVIRTNAYNTNSSNNIVGDVNIDYKITKDGRFSAQVFNRSNFNTYYYQYTYYKMAPYTQGIGLSYSKSFDRLVDLFKKRTNVPMPNRPMLNRPKGVGIPTNTPTPKNEPTANQNDNQNQNQNQNDNGKQDPNTKPKQDGPDK